MIITPRTLINSEGRHLALTIGREYEVLGIEADDYRILNDHDDPVLYAPEDLLLLDPSEPGFWNSSVGEDGERYAYPESWNRRGFFEDFHDRIAPTREAFWETLFRLYPKAASGRHWRPFLERLSREVLADPDQRAFLPPEAVASGWLGFPPAAMEELATLEQRLGVRLPESYRSFLLTTNGFRTASHSLELLPLLPANEVTWFREKHQDWLDAWEEGATMGGPLPTVSDEEYFVYGRGQDPCKFRFDYWRATLAIAGRCGVWTYLLNPLVVTPDGEWEAWLFHGEGAWRYRTFWDLMQNELETFVKLRDDIMGGPH